MSIASILNIANSGLNASQTAIQTVSHNVSNVDTPGYSRQQVELTEADPTASSVGLMGNGVSVQGIKSYLDQNLQDAITSKNSDVQEQQVSEQYLTQIQSVFDESNSNLSTNLTNFFNSWSTLSTDPTNTSDKQAVASSGQMLCSTFNTMSSDLSGLQTNLNGEVSSQIDEINGITSQIASLNSLISQSSTGTSTANDYVDQRNQLLQQLSGYMNISYYSDNSTNMVGVLTSKGTTLVDGTASYNLTPGQEASGMTSVVWQGPSDDSIDITDQISGGSLGAALTARDSTIPGYLSNLNSLAQSVAQNVNYFHEQGNDSAGVPFFQCSDTSNYASGISLSSQIVDASGTAQTQNIMASSSTTDTTDNDVAARIASLESEPLMGGSAIDSGVFASASTSVGLTSDATLAVNGVGVTLHAGDSLNDIAAAVNSAASSTGVTAQVVQASSGYKLVLSATVAVPSSWTQNSPSQALSTDNPDQLELPGGVDVTFQAGQSLNDEANAINRYQSTTGLTASVFQNNSGTYQLLLSPTGNGSAPPALSSVSVVDGSLTVPSTSASSVTGTLGLSGFTWVAYEAGVVSGVGQATTNATDLATYNQSALTSLQQQQSQESGVSIDEEMTNMILYQNAYQASARLYTLAQTMLNSLLQSVGVTTS